MNLQEEINERVSFLKEQINANNEPEINNTFQLQIETLRSTDTENVANIILRKKAALEKTRSLDETERLFTELEALEWLQRQVIKHL